MNKEKQVVVDYLYLDLSTCERCVGTDQVLEEVLTELAPAFELAGYDIIFNLIEVEDSKMAEEYKFLSSPTIRVNGKDICDSVQENDCGCCGEISGTSVGCRVFEYEGKLYEVPPKEMLAEAVLKYAFEKAEVEDNYNLPENLKKFFGGKEKKTSCCSGGCSCC